MALRLVTAKQEITSINARFASLFRDNGNAVRATVGARSGSGVATVHWLPELKVWGCFQKLDNRYWNAFGLTDPYLGKAMDIDCEINPRLTGVDQQVGGAYAVDDVTASTYILHNGKIAGGRKGIGKKLFWKRYGKARPQLDVQHNGSIYHYALVANLDDPHALQHISRFVYIVERIRTEKSITRKQLASYGVSEPTHGGDSSFLVCHASGPESVEHLRETVEKSFPASRFWALEPDSRLALNSAFPNGRMFAWGLRPGSGNDRTWDRLRVGDDVAFFTDGELRYHSRIAYKIDSESVADVLWGTDTEGRHFSHVFALTAPVRVWIDLGTYNDLLSYNLDRSPQGTFLLDDRRALILRRHIERILAAPALAASRDLEIAMAVDPDKLDDLLQDVAFGKEKFPNLISYDPATQQDTKPWERTGGEVDFTAALQKLERRSAEHNSIVKALARVALRQQLATASSDYIDLLIDQRVIVEVKTIDENPTKQVRAALAQLFHYRFAYRNQLKSPRLVAVFSRPLDGKFEVLQTFLNECGIGTAWPDASGEFWGDALSQESCPMVFPRRPYNE
jgi:hypothetical protein